LVQHMGRNSNFSASGLYGQQILCEYFYPALMVY
jgi:hypothetical protein